MNGIVFESILFFLVPGLAALYGNHRLWAFEHLKPFSAVFFAGVPFYIFLSYFWKSKIRSFSLRASVALLSSLILATCALLILLRMRLLLKPPEGLGDSALLMEVVPVFSTLFGFLDSFDEPLELFFRSKVYLIFSERGIIESYQILSIASGFLHMVVLFLFIRARNFKNTLLSFFLLLFQPGLQLYAGYLENYSLTNLYIFALFAVSLIHFERMETESQSDPGKNRILLALLGILAAWTTLHHMIAGVSALPLAYLTWITARKDRKEFIKLALCAALPALTLLFSFWIWFFLFSSNPPDFLRSHTARPPIYPFRSLVSTKHFLDMFNLLFLAAPAGMLVFLPALWARIQEAKRNGAQLEENRFRKLVFIFAPGYLEKFLLLSCLTYYAAIFILDPQLGYPADWDLHTFFRVPFNFYFFYMTVRYSPLPRRQAAIVVLSLIFTVPWILRNAAENPGSQINAHRAQESSDSCVRLIQSDPVYASIASFQRRKLYVKIRLFLIDSALIAKREEKAAIFLPQIKRFELETEKIFIMDQAEFDRKLPPFWESLTVLNKSLDPFR